MKWQSNSDLLGPLGLQLDINANTKRTVLATLNAIYDLLGVTLPLLNRAKLFLHRLQCAYKLEWDVELSPDLLKEWRTICKQCNSCGEIKLDRFIGGREEDYSLVAFSDSSAAIYGIVIYIIEKSTGRVSFLMAKNKVVNTKLTNRSIPSLECQGVVLAAETLIELYTELSSDKTISPINIEDLYVYTDSMCALSWIKSCFVTHSKIQKHSVYVKNRLKTIGDVCKVKPITFRFVEGRENPADCVTRPLSYKALSNTSYFSGPSYLKDLPEQPEFQVKVSNPVDEDALIEDALASKASVNSASVPGEDYDVPLDKLTLNEHFLPINKVSSFAKLTRVYKSVLKYINNSRMRVGKSSFIPSDQSISSFATNVLIRTEQKIQFPDIVKFFEESMKNRVAKCKIPNLVLQLNLYVDSKFIIRVKGKLQKNHPILLSKTSELSKIIILDIHKMFLHFGVYTVLRELRNRFWILSGFSTVRKLLRNCVTCKKVNERPIKLSQNSYREFRSSPSHVPFGSIFIYLIGPINARFEGKVRKTWLLIVTCLYTRAISLHICLSADTPEFLRCLQLHVYRYGMFQLCLSDLGTQLKAGAAVISDFLDDFECAEYFREHGIQKLTFNQYAKGNSALGSLVEVLVKQTKSLIIKSIGKVILSYPQFDLLVARVNHVINRRPVTYKESLREGVECSLPEPITPEMLLHGRELTSVNIIPSVQPDPYSDPDNYSAKFKDDYERLQSVIAKLNNLYHTEFLHQLMSQSIDQRDRYKTVDHKVIKPGDVVLLVEPQTKRSNYPMAVVKKVNVNSLGEVVSAIVLKGKSREKVFRHASSIIPILSSTKDDEESTGDCNTVDSEAPSEPVISRRAPTRKAALDARTKMSEQVRDNLF